VPDESPESEPTVTSLPELLRTRRERLGYVGDEGIDEVAGIAAVTPERWRQMEREGVLPAPDELPRIALALVDMEVSGPADDPGEVLARLRATLGPDR
jgi:hypothetical protein